MALRLVLDTNVWLDWLVFDDPAVQPLRLAVGSGGAEIVIDAACKEELTRALGYPLQKWTLDAPAQAACLANCRKLTRQVSTTVTTALPACADPDDQKFIELAYGAAADFLITRDLALLALARRKPPLPFPILTPAQFLWPRSDCGLPAR